MFMTPNQNRPASRPSKSPSMPSELEHKRSKLPPTTAKPPMPPVKPPAKQKGWCLADALKAEIKNYRGCRRR